MNVEFTTFAAARHVQPTNTRGEQPLGKPTNTRGEPEHCTVAAKAKAAESAQHAVLRHSPTSWSSSSGGSDHPRLYPAETKSHSYREAQIRSPKSPTTPGREQALTESTIKSSQLVYEQVLKAAKRSTSRRQGSSGKHPSRTRASSSRNRGSSRQRVLSRHRDGSKNPESRPRVSSSRNRSSSRQRLPSRHRDGSKNPDQKKGGPQPQKQASSWATSTTRASSTTLSQPDFAFNGRVHGVALSEAEIVAEKVASLSEEPLENAWNQVRSEFQVQSRIWESLALMRKAMSDNAKQKEQLDAAKEAEAARAASFTAWLPKALTEKMEAMNRQTMADLDQVASTGAPEEEGVQDPFTSLRNQVASILETAAMDYLEPIEAFEDLLQNEQYQEGLSNAFLAAGQAVFVAEVVSSKREELYEHLTEKLDDYDNLELEEMLRQCEFQDCKLEYRVRQVLRLGLRSALLRFANDSEGPRLDLESVLRRKQVRFDLAEYCDDDAPTRETRLSDCVFVHSDGVVVL